MVFNRSFIGGGFDRLDRDGGWLGVSIQVGIQGVTVQNFVFILKSVLGGNKLSEGKLILHFRYWFKSVLEVSEGLSINLEIDLVVMKSLMFSFYSAT